MNEFPDCSIRMNPFFYSAYLRLSLFFLNGSILDTQHYCTSWTTLHSLPCILSSIAHVGAWHNQNWGICLAMWSWVRTLTYPNHKAFFANFITFYLLKYSFIWLNILNFISFLPGEANSLRDEYTASCSGCEHTLGLRIFVLVNTFKPISCEGDYYLIST